MPGDLKQAMVSRLKYGNEYSLRKRMKLLLGSLSRQSRHLVSEHEAAFVDSVVATRNYLTHYDPESKDAALDGVALSKVNTQLQKLLLLLLLKDIGIDEEVVGNAIAKNGRFRQHYVTW